MNRGGTTRQIIGAIGAHESWARTPDRAARTAPGRRAFLERFEREVDPDGILSPEERTVRAEHARKAYFQRLALRSAKARATGGCEHTDGLDDAMARLEQSLALSDELVGSIARRTVTAVADHRDVPAAAAHVMLQQENSGYPVFEVTL